MTAVWLRVRAELRSRLRAALALALVIGLGGGVVLASAAGARRTDSAYSRFIRTVDPPQAAVASGTPASRGELPIVDFTKLERLPQVLRVDRSPALFGVLQTGGGDVLWNGDLNIDGTTNRALWNGPKPGKLLAGRFPNPDRPDEIAVGYQQQPDPRVHVGARLGIALLRAGLDPFTVFSGDLPRSDHLPPFRVTVTGVVLLQGELSGSTDILVTPAFFRAETPKAFAIPIEAFWFRHGSRDLPAFGHELNTIAPGALSFTVHDEAVQVNRSTHLSAIALWLFAGLAGVALLLVFGQALARQTFLDADENPMLRVLGMTTGQLFAATMARAALLGAVAAVAAIVVAVALSPIMPLGHVARLAEPHPGFAFDVAVLAGGAGLVVVAVVLAAVVPAWRAARLRGDTLGAVEVTPNARPSAVADAFARGGLPPTAVTGVRPALEPGRGKTAVPVRTTLAGVMLTVAAFVTAVGFRSSFEHLTQTPRLYGVAWDLVLGNPYSGPGLAQKAVPALESDPAIRNIVGANVSNTVELGTGTNSQRLYAWSLQPLRGSVHPTVVEGRWPAAPDEIAFGGKTLRGVGAHIGDEVPVSAGRRAIRMRVVGRAVFPGGAFGPGLGEGLGMTLEGLRRLVPGVPMNTFLVTIAPGTDLRAEARKIDRELGSAVGADRGDAGPEIDNLDRIRNLPLVLAGLLGLAAIGTLAHTLVTSIRRRRRDLAILKTLGFVRRQVSATVAWQASALSVVALVVGVPLGIAVGRWAWSVFADQLGVVPEPVIPVALALLVVPATILLANLVAAIPGRVAGRLRPAQVLRTE